MPHVSRHLPYSRDFVISEMKATHTDCEARATNNIIIYHTTKPSLVLLHSCLFSAGPMCLTQYFTLVSCQPELININVCRSSFGILIGSRLTQVHQSIRAYLIYSSAGANGVSKCQTDPKYPRNMCQMSKCVRGGWFGGLGGEEVT